MFCGSFPSLPLANHNAASRVTDNVVILWWRLLLDMYVHMANGFLIRRGHISSTASTRCDVRARVGGATVRADF